MTTANLVISTTDSDSNGIYDDVDALARLAKNELSPLVGFYTTILGSQTAAIEYVTAIIVDQVINRAASGSTEIYGGRLIQNVINEPAQYSGVQGEGGGSWTGLPTADAAYVAAVEKRLAERVSGQASIIGTTNDFLNPTIVKPEYDKNNDGIMDNWAKWGKGMTNKMFIGVNPFNPDGTVIPNIPETTVLGNANNLRPDPFTISYDVDKDGVIEAGETSGLFDPHGWLGVKIDSPNAQTEDLNNLDPGAGDNDASDIDNADVQELLDLWDMAGEEASPLVLDLDGDGIELINLQSGDAVYWDVDNDGMAEASAWVGPDDGLLVIDSNNDGIINNHIELFGDKVTDGFSELRLNDSNGDNKITAEDTVWGDLRVWRDANGNGYSEATELHTLDDLQITQIDLNASTTNIVNAGNTITHTSTYTIGGNTRSIVDAWFKYSDVNTVYNKDFVMDGRVMLLPTAKGYGDLPILSVAMSLDNSATGNLLDRVSNLHAKTFADLFDSTNTTADDVRAIIYRWAGVESVVTGSRGLFVDAHELAFLEKMTGQPFLQNGLYSNPGVHAGYTLTQAFDLAFNHIYATLLAQGAGGELFTGNVVYNPALDTLEGITGLDLTKLGSLETEAMGLGSTAAKETFWSNVVRVIEYTIGTDNLSSGDLDALEDAIVDTDSTLSLTSILGEAVFTPEFTTTNGTSSGETLNGGSDNDLINGNGGNDTFNGNAGNDTFEGGTGNDTFNGGLDSDLAYGRAGNDTYIYNVNGGYDVYEDTSGTDKIQFGAGITLSHLTFVRAGENDLVINISNGSFIGEITIRNQFKNGQGIETIQFSDSSTFNLATQSWTMTGTYGYDTLWGVQYGASQNDTLNGGDGNDVLWGRDGNDTLNGGNGVDEIYGGYGTDTISGGDGNDRIEGNDGNDTLAGNAGNDFIDGGYGNDTYTYASGHDTLQDISGTDVINLPSGFTSGATVYYKILDDLKIVFDANNSITIKNHFAGGGAVETLNFNGGPSVNLTTVAYTLQGDNSNNTLNGTFSDNTFYGMGGSDTLNGYAGADTLDGGDGDDTMYGGDGNDILLGGLGADILDGGNNDDIMNGGAGNDTLRGGYGNDTYIYVSGHDIMNEQGSGSAADVIEMVAGWTLEDLSFKRYSTNPYDLVIEINSSNTITLDDYFYSTYYAFETLKFSDNSTFNLLNVQPFTYGTAGNDYIYNILYNGSIDDVIYGLDGSDYLYGGTGNDMLIGGNGNDTLYGQGGDDILDGGAGDDTLWGDSGDDTFLYGSGLDSVNAFSGTDTLRLIGGTTINDITVAASGYNAVITVQSGINVVTVVDHNYSSTYQLEKIQFDDGFLTTFTDYATWTKGTSSADTQTGTSSHNVMIGYAGNDTLDGAGGDDDIHGGSGNDTLIGGDGADQLHGGVGDDILRGANGLDTLYGGAGADSFIFYAANAFNNIDVIKDFSTLESDTLNIADLLTGYTAGVSDINDFVSLSVSGADSRLFVDRDGTGSTYSSAQIATLSNVTGLDVDALLMNNNLTVV
jgi:Ca2+-binding RTX toxin-like protein